MSDHEHDYRKLNDEAVFCRSCGDIKTVQPPVCTLPHYPIYPYVIPSLPWTPSYPWWGTTTFGEVGSGSTIVYADGTSVTYTAEAVS